MQLVGDRDALDGAAKFFASRYGDAVAVRWLVRNRFLDVLHRFCLPDPEGRRMRVSFALDPNGQQPGSARVAEEADEQIVIALSRREPVHTSRMLMAGLLPGMPTSSCVKPAAPEPSSTPAPKSSVPPSPSSAPDRDAGDIALTGTPCLLSLNSGEKR